MSFGENRAKMYAVSMGNPHCVLLFEDPNINLDALDWRIWGKELEVHDLFPNRSNIQFVQIIDNNNIRLRIWERGQEKREVVLPLVRCLR